jgi:hypothetical protein
MVYALGNKGSELIAEGLGLPARSIDWTAKNRSLRPTFYRHTLMVSGVMVAFEVACRRHGTVRLIPWEEVLETKCPPETRKKAKPQTCVTGTPKLPPCWTLKFPPPATKGWKSWKKS